MDYKELLSQMRSKWIGQEVEFEGHKYIVVGVDYNGGLLINKPAEFTDTTAIPVWMVK